MAESSSETKNKILKSAKKEFLEKGFVNASLRTIAANAGVTTGAMYRHFKDKDALFCALVDPAIEVTRNAVMTADVITHMKDEDPLGKEHEEKEDKIVTEFLDYIYSDFDAFILLVSKASGSTHEKFIDEMKDLYTSNCIETFNWMYKKKFIKRKLDNLTMHVIASSIINAFTEFITHMATKEEAIKFITEITEFFHYGTLGVLDKKAD